MECWMYQSCWLQCPITGKFWTDPHTMLGVGIYHAPRFLSPEEQQRYIDDRKAAEQTNLEHKKKIKAGEVVAWDQNFDVYPSIPGPPKGTIKELQELNENTKLGYVEVLIGPCFDKAAYNDGIVGNAELGVLPLEQRGVEDLDQQWNAFNFVYYVERAEGSYERKYITNRLSFYIDPVHGSRIFPGNIESQLSLLVWRDSRIRSEGQTNQQLLAHAIRVSIPKILRACIMEIIHGKANAKEERWEHCLRTYLLVHQVSIKLILKYPTAYQGLYTSIMRWIQQPFSNDEWQLEEILIGASLVGIPWSILREAFLRKLLVTLIRTNNLKDGVPIDANKLTHIFHTGKTLIQIILYQFCFFGTGTNISELDKIYERCAGTLPHKDRVKIKQSIDLVDKIDSIQKFWVTLGMDVDVIEPEIITFNMCSYLTFLNKNVATWEKMRLPPDTRFNIPPISESSVGNVGVLQFNSDREKLHLAKLAEERAKHKDYPELVKGKLSPLQCLYPQCGKKFKCRDHLFAHLKLMIPPDRMVNSWHQMHFKSCRPKVDSTQCPACKKEFDSVDECIDHCAEMGVPGYSWVKKKPKQKEEPKVDEKKEEAVDPSECVVCMDAKRNVVNVPCGHIVCCMDCGILLKQCPMCRTAIRDVLKVFYS